MIRKGEENKKDDSKKVDFKELILKKLSDEIGLEALGKNGGLSHAGKWEPCHTVTIPSGIRDLTTNLKYSSGKCISKNLAKCLETNFRPIREFSKFHS